MFVFSRLSERRNARENSNIFKNHICVSGISFIRTMHRCLDIIYEIFCFISLIHVNLFVDFLMGFWAASVVLRKIICKNDILIEKFGRAFKSQFIVDVVVVVTRLVIG